MHLCRELKKWKALHYIAYHLMERFWMFLINLKGIGCYCYIVGTGAPFFRCFADLRFFDLQEFFLLMFVLAICGYFTRLFMIYKVLNLKS